MKKIGVVTILLVAWVAVFLFTMNYIGSQWEYEGRLSTGLIAGISRHNATGILYSIATILASIVVASSIVGFVTLLFRKNNTVRQKAFLKLSIVGVCVILVAFAWNRYQIHQSSQTVKYGFYDSDGRLLEPDKYLKNLRDVNVLLISIDTLNPEHLGCYGYDRNTSPEIDSLARGGILFKHAYSQSPKTSPSHMSMFTSLYPSVHKIRNWNELQGVYSLDHHLITIGEIMKHAGYKTVAFTGGGNVQSSIGFDHGFDIYDNHDKVWTRAFEWLDQNHDDKFFLFLHTFEVHSPYLPPPPYNTMFGEPYHGEIRDSEAELDEFYKENYQTNGSFPGYHRLFWDLVDRSNSEDVARVISLYDGGIRFMNDQMLGVLLNKLKEYGLDKNTLIIFTSDHGEEFLQHGDFLHKELYDEHIHVPLIFRFPDQDFEQQQTIEQQVRTIDLFPTILDYLNLPVPVMAQGTSLLPAIQGQDLDLPAFSERIVITDLPDMKKSLRTSDWKYIWWPTKEKQELYNLIKDPGERMNVAEQESEVAAGLHKRIIEWMKVNEQKGSTIRAYTSTFDKETVEKLKSLGYIR